MTNPRTPACQVLCQHIGILEAVLLRCNILLQYALNGTAKIEGELHGELTAPAVPFRHGVDISDADFDNMALYIQFAGGLEQFEHGLAIAGRNAREPVLELNAGAWLLEPGRCQVTPVLTSWS